MSGQRRYDLTMLYRLAIIQRAHQLGFTLAEIREVSGPANRTWHNSSLRA